MRYAFNMVTMMKEKVNTHFSFPLQLNMAPYTEDFLMGDKQDQGTLWHDVAALHYYFEGSVFPLGVGVWFGRLWNLEGDLKAEIIAVDAK